MNQTLGERLVQLRNERSLTQDEVATVLEVSNKTISKWENNASEPDISKLIALASFYNVSVDNLLGLEHENALNAADSIITEIQDQCSDSVVLKTAELLNCIIPSVYPKMGEVTHENAIPENSMPAPRSRIMSDSLFAYTCNSSKTNIALFLFGNTNNFAWMTDPEAREAICGLFKFLSDPDSLALLYMINHSDFPLVFTADYLAEKLGIEAQKVNRLLIELCDFRVCSRDIAHFKSSERELFNYRGEGMLISLLTIAHELRCGVHWYNYNYSSRCKMIRGEK